MGLRDAMGRGAVARDTAETVGQVHGAVVDVGARRIVALQLGKGHKAQLADWSAITGVGPDAVVVDSGASLRAARGEREERIVKGEIALLGAKVLSDRGDALGTLDDVEFDEATGEILTLVCGGNSVGAGRLRSMGGFATVVTAHESG